MKYAYSVMTLADVKPRDRVFVPNTDAETTLQIWRWLTGRRADFPKYFDGDVLIGGILEDAWTTPKEYSNAYCPLDMSCIVRKQTK